MTTVQPFTFPATGQPVRTVTIDGEPIIKGLEGHLYAVEFNNGRIKVGYTADPQTRIRKHAADAQNFGQRLTRGVITGPHVEARTNERALIRMCHEAAKMPSDYAGEYFPLDLDTAAAFIAQMPQSRGDRAVYEADTACQGDRVMSAIGLTHSQQNNTTSDPFDLEQLYMESLAELERLGVSTPTTAELGRYVWAGTPIEHRQSALDTLFRAYSHLLAAEHQSL